MQNRHKTKAHPVREALELPVKNTHRLVEQRHQSSHTGTNVNALAERPFLVFFSFEMEQ
jgi:hypothetical protein